MAMGSMLQGFQRMTMSEGTGPSNEERHCADADGDDRFSYDEGPQSRQKHEDAAHDEDCRLGRKFRCRAHCSLHGRYAFLVALTASLDLFICAKDLFVVAIGR